MITENKLKNSRQYFDVINPHTKKRVGTVPITSVEQVQNALKSSYDFNPLLSAEERSKLLKRVSIELRANQEEIARIITSESGICLKDTFYEVERAAKVASFASLVAEKIEEDVSQRYQLEPSNRKPKLRVITEPLKLIVAITPFNHPLNQVAHKVFPAIAAGACVILKPSSKTPFSAFKLQELLFKVGLPKDMFHIIIGVPPDRIVDQLVAFPDLDMVTFTGGFEVGLRIVHKMVESGNALKKLVLELGGCSPLIVNEDADIEAATSIAISGCFGNSGQRCTAIRRIVVLEKIANQFVQAFAEKARTLKWGDPFDPQIDMGTLISEEAARLVEERVNRAIKDGAKLILGNQRQGALYTPTILDHVDTRSKLVAEETFGPVGSVIRVQTLDEAIAVANQTNYRLAGAIVTKSKEVAERVSKLLGVGQFNWNGVPSYRTECAPFGGFKNSGNGEKEGVIHAAYGMRRIRTFYEH